MLSRAFGSGVIIDVLKKLTPIIPLCLNHGTFLVITGIGYLGFLLLIDVFVYLTPIPGILYECSGLDISYSECLCPLLEPLIVF